MAFDSMIIQRKKGLYSGLDLFKSFAFIVSLLILLAPWVWVFGFLNYFFSDFSLP